MLKQKTGQFLANYGYGILQPMPGTGVLDTRGNTGMGSIFVNKSCKPSLTSGGIDNGGMSTAEQWGAEWKNKPTNFKDWLDHNENPLKIEIYDLKGSMITSILEKKDYQSVLLDIKNANKTNESVFIVRSISSDNQVNVYKIWLD